MGRRNNRNHKLPPFQHSGILLVDKPKEWTSHDVVNFVRGRFNIKKVGHCGTLDPAATGLLVLVLGIMTKKSQELSGSDKTYTGTILFGKETDSQDMEGEVTAEHDTSFLTPEMVEEEFAKFAGPQQQIPPMVSAVTKGGKKLYELAREGKVIERDPRDIVINSITTSNINLPYADFEVSCSKGTYIRTLCADIGTNLKCGGVLYSLCRTQSGNFKLENAHTIEEIKEWDQEDLLKGLADYEEFF